jgi:hypothetical protein
MKIISGIFAILPPLFLSMALAFISSEHTANIMAWTWIGCSVACLGWGIIIFWRFRKLALMCLAVGGFNVILAILLPFVAYVKMKHLVS